MRRPRTDTPFSEEVPQLLRDRGMSLHALAIKIGVSEAENSFGLFWGIAKLSVHIQ